MGAPVPPWSLRLQPGRGDVPDTIRGCYREVLQIHLREEFLFIEEESRLDTRDLPKAT